MLATTPAPGGLRGSQSVGGNLSTAAAAYKEVDAILSGDGRRRSGSVVTGGVGDTSTQPKLQRSATSLHLHGPVPLSSKASNLAKSVWGSFVGAINPAAPIDARAREANAAAGAQARREARRRRSKSKQRSSSQDLSATLERVRGVE